MLRGDAQVEDRWNESDRELFSIFKWIGRAGRGTGRAGRGGGDGAGRAGGGRAGQAGGGKASPTGGGKGNRHGCK